MLLLGLAALFAPFAKGDESLARIVPADVGLFVELHDGADLLLPLSDPQVWLTLAEFTGQPARLDEARDWRRRVQDTIGLSPPEAIRALLAQRVAFVAATPRKAHDAALLCRPPDSQRHDLLKRWKKQPLPNAGRASLYRLNHGVGLATFDDILLFGDVTAGSPVVRDILRMTEPNSPPSLADSPDFRRLLARVPGQPDGILFARLQKPAAASKPSASAPAGDTAPLTGASETAVNARAIADGRPLPGGTGTAKGFVAELPGPLRGATEVLFALHRKGELLHISAVGNAPSREKPDLEGSASLETLVEKLPQRTLVAWAGRVDYPRLLQTIEGLPERNVLRVAYRLQEKSGAAQHLAGALSESCCVAVGAVPAEQHSVPTPPSPAIAVLAVARDPAAAAEEWQRMMELTVSMYNLLSLKVAATVPQLSIESQALGSTQIQQIDLTRLLGDERSSALGAVQLSWAVDGDVLILASHAEWLRQIIAARHDQGPNLRKTLALSQQPISRRGNTLFVVQAGPVADLGALWLNYLEQNQPQALTDRYWRRFQPGGRDIELGINVRVDGDEQRLLVESVKDGSPADGILTAGDALVGCNGHRFATSQPVEEVRKALADRPDSMWFDVIVERADNPAQIRRVPLPFWDPVQLLRRVVAIGRVAQRIVYQEDDADPAGSRGLLTIELRRGEESLFPFEMSPPVQPVGAGSDTAPPDNP